ncbi:hypothetical protein ACIO6U_02845 [Streptomyces sp. NPDC087422]|uniref:hypothetical protein n=1 Tax=Streptomyces sp. NPDC087422 TaxID=3365786 RepID=UPI00382E801C
MPHFRPKPVDVEAWQWIPGDLTAVGAVVGTLMGYGIPFRHPSGAGPTTTLRLGDGDTGPLAQPGDWVVCVDGERWGIVEATDFAMRYELAPTTPAAAGEQPHA